MDVVVVKMLIRMMVALFVGGMMFPIQAETLAQAPQQSDGSPYIDGSGGVIRNLAELRWLSETPQAWDETWVQSADIDASETAQWNVGDHDISPDTADEPMGFSPIGNLSNSFTGRYDGGGYRISGLYINRPNSDSIGLFGLVDTGTLEHLVLGSVYIRGRNNVGALLGNLFGGTVNHSLSSGAVFAVGTERNEANPDQRPGSNAGGLIGYVHGGDISYSHSSAKVTVTVNYVGVSQPVGGLVGRGYSGQIAHCSASGLVTGVHSGGGLIGMASHLTVNNSWAAGDLHCVEGGNCGGLIGDMEASLVADSFATGSVKADSIYVGGLIGMAYRGSRVERAYATGDVIAGGYGGGLLGRCDSSLDNKVTYVVDSFAQGRVDGAHNIGALVGVTWSGCNITNSYATGVNKALIGSVYEAEPEVVNSFFDCGVGGASCAAAHAKTTAELQQLQTFIDAGWDLGDFDRAGTWRLNHQDYPSLTLAKAALFTTQPDELSLVATEDNYYELQLQVEALPENQAVEFVVMDAPGWLQLQQQGTTVRVFGTPADAGVGEARLWLRSINQGVKNDFPLQLLFVENINDLPAAQDAAFATAEDTGIDIDLAALVSDDDFIHGGEQHKFVIDVPSEHGQAMIKGSVVRFMPMSDFYGTTEFEYSVEDSALARAVGRITVNVLPVADIPVMEQGRMTLAEDNTGYLDLNLLVKDPDGDSLSFSVGSAAHGQVLLNGSVVQYLPHQDYAGVDRFSISVFDGSHRVTGEVLVMVVGVNDAPIMTGAPNTEVNLGEFYRFVPKVQDVDGDQLSFQASNLPAWMELNQRSGELLGKPTTEEHLGRHENIVIRVSDGIASASLTFNLEVIGEPEADFAVDDHLSLTPTSDEKYLLNVLANDKVAAGEALSITGAFSQDGQVSIHGKQLQLQLLQPLSRVSLVYYVQNESGQQDSANVVLTLQRTDMGEVVIETPALLSIDATGVLTEVVPVPPKAFDGAGNPVPVSRVDSQTHFVSGRHVLTWKANDAQGNPMFAQQQLHIRPQVLLPADAQVFLSAYEHYRVGVSLSGAPVSYPVTVEYRLIDEVNGQHSNESLVIHSGLTGEIDLIMSGNAPEGEEPVARYRIELEPTANPGTKNQFVLMQTPVPNSPRLSHSIKQGTELRTLVALPAQGSVGVPVEIVVTVTNARDGEQYLFDWHAENLPLVVEDQLSQSVARFQPEPSMEPGLQHLWVEVRRLGAEEQEPAFKYSIYLEMKNQLPELSGTLDSDGDGIPDLTEGFVDSDQDGIPDYLDAMDIAHVLPSRVAEQNSYLLETEAGLILRKGVTIAEPASGGGLLEPERDPITLEADRPIVGGVYDFVIQGLSHPGEVAAIVLPQFNPIPANALYRKYLKQDGADGQWQNFDLASGALFSAKGQAGYCPSVNAAEWRQGLNEGDWCVKLLLRDGGNNDADGVANGTIVDPGGVAVIVGDNSLPKLNDDEFIVFNDQSVAVLDVLANDLDAEDPLSILSAKTSHGQISHDGQVLTLTLPEVLPEEIQIQYTVIELRESGVVQAANARVSFKARPVKDDSGAISLGYLFALVWLACGRFAYHRYGKRR